MGIPGALSNPIANAISNHYVESKHKGKYNSAINISKILGSAVASIIVAWGVTSNNQVITFFIITIFFLLDYLFTIKFLPVISAGISKPIAVSIVGAMSQSAPSLS